LVKSMVEHIQGTIDVTSHHVEELLTQQLGTNIAKTTFTVTIPTVLERH
jgi:alcohol dehydrogenase YqhD (iron-dependent ADH family)